ncbi:MAG TPA: hypothetical protein VNS09_01130 [Solirubrobacter sp.]|nr:hypothetical protein [Solirubrobacter sp.]
MRLPIDTSRLQFLVVAEAERLLKFEKGKPREASAPRVDENGEVLSRVQVVALGDGEAEIIRVTVAGDPGVKQGEMVRVEGMTAQAWEMDDRNGMAFRAASIRSVNAREKAAALMTGELTVMRRDRWDEQLGALVIGVAGAL